MFTKKYIIFAVMEEIEKFKAEAKKRNLCDNYTHKLDGSHSKKQLIDIGMDSNGIPYLCKSMLEGWGVSADFLKKKFSAFINGNYKSQQKGYTSMMYVFNNDDIYADATNVVIIESTCNVYVKKNQIVNIFCVKSNIDIIGEGKVYLYEYGECGVQSSLETKLTREEV